MVIVGHGFVDGQVAFLRKNRALTGSILEFLEVMYGGGDRNLYLPYLGAPSIFGCPKFDSTIEFTAPVGII